MSGIVYLIGAGPGDYRLLTLKGKECLEKADVVVYDYLADKRLLSMARKDAELIYVGKKAGNHAMKQEDINLLLANKASEGKIVARLKGGDPFVFGRGGEEAMLLKKRSIAFEIVPGVTSAIAAPAYAGIPVTNRNVATSFAVITGHEDPTKPRSTINWEKLSTGTDTLVFLMGISNIQTISNNLIKYGRNPQTPAAFVRWGTKATQEVLVTTVEKAYEDLQKNDLKPPAIFIVGDVVNLRYDLQWFDNKPLFGKNILITRARKQSSKLTFALENLGAHCIEAPSIEIVAPLDNYESMDVAIDNIKKYQWIIFTSTNGVDYFFNRLFDRGLDSRSIDAKIVAIGTTTANQLKKYGIIANKIPEIFVAEGIIDVLREDLQNGDNILIPRAMNAREILPQMLKKIGANVDVVQAYYTKMANTNKEELKNLLSNNDIDMVTFTSSSTVENLLKLIDDDKELLQNVTSACIGPITAQTCKKNGIKVDIEADIFTIDGLVNKILEYGR